MHAPAHTHAWTRTRTWTYDRALSLAGQDDRSRHETRERESDGSYNKDLAHGLIPLVVVLFVVVRGIAHHIPVHLVIPSLQPAHENQQEQNQDNKPKPAAWG